MENWPIYLKNLTLDRMYVSCIFALIISDWQCWIMFQAQYLLRAENFWGGGNLGNFVTLWFAYKTANLHVKFYDFTTFFIFLEKYCIEIFYDAWVINILLLTNGDGLLFNYIESIYQSVNKERQTFVKLDGNQKY